MNNKIIAAVVLGCTIMLSSCQKEETDSLPEGAILLTTEGFHGNEKTSVSGNTVQWDGSSTETVNINGDDYEVHVSGNHAYINPGGAISGSTVYGYYPHNIVTADGWETTSPTVTIPSTYDCHYNDGRQIIALPMVAYGNYGSTPNNIEFKHLTAAVKVMVRNEISSSLTLKLDKVVVSSSSYLLSGRTPVTLNNNDNPTVNAVTTSSKNSVTVNFTDHPTIPYSTGSDDNRIEVQVPIRPIGNGSTTPITVEVFAYEEGNPGRTFTFRKENVSVSTLGRNVMLTAGCRISSETGNVTEFNYLTTPLTFEAKTANATVTFTPATGKTLEYSTDGITWNTYSTAITLANIGDKVSFRGDNTSMATISTYSSFSCSGDCYVYGNIMSLLNKNNFSTLAVLTDAYTFRNLFQNNTRIHNHPSKTLSLPATTLTNNCYQNMFKGCTNLTSAPYLPATSLTELCYYNMFFGCSYLTSAPELPATSLANKCYMCMFQGCTKLTSAPALPATSLATYCYSSMFSGCTSLILAPELPATTLTNSCYEYMFQGCTNLISAPTLPASSLSDYCYQYMFQNCTSLSSPPSLPATTLAIFCYYYMFEGCVRLTSSPELSALTLNNSCYSHMFKGCSGLTSAPSLPAMTLASSCYEHMFQDCSSLTRAPDLLAPTLVSSCYQYMFKDCSNLNSIKCLAEPTIPTGTTTCWLQGVSTTGTFTKAKKMTYWSNDNNGIPSGWTVVNAN